MAENKEKNNQEELESPAKPVSPQEERRNQLLVIDQKLAELTYHTKNKDEIIDMQVERDKREKKYQEEIQKLEGDGTIGLSEESKNQIYEKMVNDVYEQALEENETIDNLKFEKCKILNLEAAEDLILSLEKEGLKIPLETKNQLLDILTSARLIDIDRKFLSELLGLENNSVDIVKDISNNPEIKRKFDLVLRNQIASTEYRQILLSEDINFADPKDFEKILDNQKIVGLNDAELTDGGIEKTKEVVRKILNDEKCNIGQGMFWNVLISKNSKFVLKAERLQDEERKRLYQRRSLLLYPIIRDAIGKKFLPKQAVLHSKENQRLFALQEKQDLPSMISVRTSNIDEILNGNYGSEILDSLKDPSNREVLQDFIKGLERLYDDHQLLLDPIGDNIYFQVVESKLLIKLVDYGCFEDKWKDDSVQINKDKENAKMFIDKLKQILVRTK